MSESAFNKILKELKDIKSSNLAIGTDFKELKASNVKILNDFQEFKTSQERQVKELKTFFIENNRGKVRTGKICNLS